MEQYTLQVFGSGCNVISLRFSLRLHFFSKNCVNEKKVPNNWKFHTSFTKYAEAFLLKNYQTKRETLRSRFVLPRSLTGFLFIHIFSLPLVYNCRENVAVGIQYTVQRTMGIEWLDQFWIRREYCIEQSMIEIIGNYGSAWSLIEMLLTNSTFKRSFYFSYSDNPFYAFSIMSKIKYFKTSQGEKSQN